MSSLSFENLFPPDMPDSPERSSNPNSSARLSQLSPQWARPLPVAFPTGRMFSDASPWAKSIRRRAMEVFVAAAALVLLMPVMALSAALVFFDSEGPVLFRQRRMGRNGREFTLYKFRSMRIKGGESSCITVSGDQRITRAGAFLRRYKLDELPQFWNVLRGDMGLVGPRPKLPHLEPLHMTYRPGLTGAATLAFRNEEGLLSTIPAHEVEAFYEVFVKPAKARLDFDYMRQASLRSDLRLIWRTFAACLSSQDSPHQVASLGETAETVIGPAVPAVAPES